MVKHVAKLSPECQTVVRAHMADPPAAASH
jgi:hypothetical protein